jgi:hypothetical protein
MNAKNLSSHYSQLTAEERFRLILAASDRGDETERDRVQIASPLINFSSADYSPFSRALHELGVFVLLELLEEAAEYHEAFHRWNGARMTEYTDGTRDTPASAESTERTSKDLFFDLFMAQGFMLQTKAAGWKVFCERMGTLPFGLWQYLPGAERLQRDLKSAEGTPDQAGAAFTPKGMAHWLNRNRPAGVLEISEANIFTAKQFADRLDATFRERVRWWGG